MEKPRIWDIVIIIFLLIIITLLFFQINIKKEKEINPIMTYPNNNIPNKKNENIICTMDVKKCADGSYVSRKSPNCSFSPCPEDQ